MWMWVELKWLFANFVLCLFDCLFVGTPARAMQSNAKHAP